MDVLNIRDKKYLTDLVASVAGQAVARSIDVVAASVVVTGTTLRALRTPSAIRAWIGAHFSLSGAEVDKEIKGVGWNGRKETKTQDCCCCEDDGTKDDNFHYRPSAGAVQTLAIYWAASATVLTSTA